MARKSTAFHSPYLFKLFTYCCEDHSSDPSFDQIENQRKDLLDSTEIISRIDFGAGSAYNKGHQTTAVSRIAKHSLSRPFQCRFMARLSTFLEPTTTLEFGTSLGISTAYLAKASPQAQVITVEGDREIWRIAQILFTDLELNNIESHCQTFDEYIASLNNADFKIDLLFLDGHHQYDATLRYYTALMPYFHEGTVIVVDDIYWSEEMTNCWKTLITSEGVTQSVDCFHFGLLFYKTEFLNKENHKIQLPLRLLVK